MKTDLMQTSKKIHNPSTAAASFGGTDADVAKRALPDLRIVKVKKGFTLVELLISIALFSIVLLFLYGAIDTLRNSNIFYSKLLEKERTRDKLFRVLYADILSSSSFAITATKDKEYDILAFTTKNSLYGIQNPTVVWYVSKDDNRTLYRMESLSAIAFPITEDSYRFVKVDEITSKMQYFKLFKKENSFLSYVKAGDKQMVFEVLVPSYLTSVQRQESNATSSSSTTASSSTTSSGSSGGTGTQQSALPALPSGSSSSPLPSSSLPPPPPSSSSPAGTVKSGSDSGSVLPPPPP